MSFLFSILIFVLFIGLLIVFVVLGFIRSLFGSLFGLGKRKNQSSANGDDTNQQTTQKSKIFGKNEGEYVDFEEIKDK